MHGSAFENGQKGHKTPGRAIWQTQKRPKFGLGQQTKQNAIWTFFIRVKLASIVQ